MDVGGPPLQSPDDYSARERRERTGVAVGIVVGVIILIAGPLTLLYVANWRRRWLNKRHGVRGLDGTTAVSQDGKEGTTRTERHLDTTLATRVDERDYELGLETEKSGEGQDTLSPLGGSSTSKVPNPVTAEEVLGLDKASYLRSLPIGGASPSTSDETTPALDITVLPSRLPPIDLADLHGESSRHVVGTSDDHDCVSPWAVEHEPNPVIFKHLLGAKGKSVDDEEVSYHKNMHEGHVQVGTYHENWMDLNDSSRMEQVQEDVEKDILAYEANRSKESSPSEGTYGSSPASTDSQTSSSALMARASPESDSHSPTMNQIIFQQLEIAPESSQGVPQTDSKTSCKHCNRSFKTAGQLNAHIHRKHVRRYSCTICANNFHLKTDLKRHERTVHRNHLMAESRGFRCTNPGCSIPEKIFLRRDNFERHVSRCARRVDGEDT